MVQALPKGREASSAPGWPLHLGRTAAPRTRVVELGAAPAGLS